MPIEEMLRKSVTEEELGKVKQGVMQFVVPFFQVNQKLPLPPELPGYWSYQRDAILRNTIYKETMWAAAISIAITKVSSLSWELSGNVPGTKMKHFKELFLQADGKQIGWVSFLSKQLQDYLLTDNGCFIEIVRATKAFGSRIVGLRHLDSLRCQRTGDPDTPILYRSRTGKIHELKDYQVLLFSDMPNPSETYYGVGTCLHGDSGVRMADGSTKRIRDLVNSKSEEEVITLLPNGTITHRKIIGWHKNLTNGRKKVNISGILSQYAMGKNPKNTWLTEDHKVLTTEGWKQAGDLQSGDLIVTEYPYPNEKQMAVLVGAVLGDGTVQLGNKRARISLSNSKKQEQWLKTKIMSLTGFGWSVGEDNSHGYEMARAMSKVQPAFNQFRDKFYDEHGKSIIPLDMLEEHLSPLLLATWYLDDGYIQHRTKDDRNRRPVASISTTALPDTDVLAACQLLTNYGYECHPVRVKEKTYPNGYATKAGYGIRFTANGSEKLFKDIAPYVPNCMRYKVPENAEAYNPNLWNLGEPDRFVDEVIVKKESRIRNVRNDSYVYCIDVEETHNFVTASIVVHNCAASRAYPAIYKLAMIEKYLQEKVTGMRPLAIYIVNGLLDTQLKQAVKVATTEEQARGMLGYMGAVMIGVADDIQPQVATIPLAELPDRFARGEEFDISLYSYADNLGLDVQDLKPLGGMALGTGTQSQILHDKARGRGLVSWKQDFTHAIDTLVLPEAMRFAFVEKDYRDLQQKAQVSLTNAQVSAARVAAAITTAPQELQVLVDSGELPREFLEKDLTGNIVSGDTDAAPVTIQPKIWGLDENGKPFVNPPTPPSSEPLSLPNAAQPNAALPAPKVWGLDENGQPLNQPLQEEQVETPIVPQKIWGLDENGQPLEKKVEEEVLQEARPQKIWGLDENNELILHEEPKEPRSGKVWGLKELGVSEEAAQTLPPNVIEYAKALYRQVMSEQPASE